MKKRYQVIFLILLSLLDTNLSYAKEKFNEKDTNWSKDKVKKYIKVAFADRSDKEIRKVIATFTAESGLACSKISKSNDIGVAQINKVHWKRFGGKDMLKSCKKNIDAAKTIYKEWGNSLKPWSAYKDGRYKKFL